MRGGSNWAVVLAGGEGERLRPFIEQRHGRAIPKQYCAFNGGKTMLEHTMERVRGVVPECQIVSVIGRGHRRFLDRTRLPGETVEQVANRGTLPGILLGLAHVMAFDPEASVVILPSDHFMEPLGGVRDLLKESLETARRHSDKLILLAAVPDEPEPDYGWIERGSALSERTFSVDFFREKPDSARAETFFKDGLLWNTMIVAVKARTLWEIARVFLPHIVARFDLLRVAVSLGRGEAMLSFVYEALDAADFSRDFLERIPHKSLVLPMTGIRWSDWGRPARIEQTLKSISSRPASSAVPLFIGPALSPLRA